MSVGADIVSIWSAVASRREPRRLAACFGLSAYDNEDYDYDNESIKLS